MKKIISKAPRAATPSPAAEPVKKSKAPAKKVAKPAPAKPAPAEAAAQPSPAVAPAEPPATFITAKIDIGFGNVLFLRGEGPGLSWDKGLPMECAAADLWTAAINDATKPVVFKFLVNDLTWCAGEDCVIAPGQSVTLTPDFY